MIYMNSQSSHINVTICQKPEEPFFAEWTTLRHAGKELIIFPKTFSGMMSQLIPVLWIAVLGYAVKDS